MFNKSFISTKDGIQCLMDCSPCGRFIVCAVYNKITKFDLQTKKQIKYGIELQDHCMESLRYSPNGLLIASGSYYRAITMLDAITLNQIWMNLEGQQSTVNSIAFSPDSLYLISGGRDETIRIWDCISSEQFGANIKVNYLVSSVEYSPNGQQIISSGGQDIDIWNQQTRQLVLKFRGHRSSISRVIYSVDNQLIASACLAIIKVWNASTGQQIGNDLIGHENLVQSLAFSPDSSWIVSGSLDKTELSHTQLALQKPWSSVVHRSDSILFNMILLDT